MMTNAMTLAVTILAARVQLRNDFARLICLGSYDAILPKYSSSAKFQIRMPKPEANPKHETRKIASQPLFGIRASFGIRILSFGFDLLEGSHSLDGWQLFPPNHFDQFARFQ